MKRDSHSDKIKRPPKIAPWSRPCQFLPHGQACPSTSRTWRINKILQATGRLLAESHLRLLSLLGVGFSVAPRRDPGTVGLKTLRPAVALRFTLGHTCPGPNGAVPL
jgi:hypothetical protein